VLWKMWRTSDRLGAFRLQVEEVEIGADLAQASRTRRPRATREGGPRRRYKGSTAARSRAARREHAPLLCRRSCKASSAGSTVEGARAARGCAATMNPTRDALTPVRSSAQVGRVSAVVAMPDPCTKVRTHAS